MVIDLKDMSLSPSLISNSFLVIHRVSGGAGDVICEGRSLDRFLSAAAEIVEL